MKKVLVSLLVVMFVAVISIPVQATSVASDNKVLVDDEKPKKKEEKKSESKEATKETKSEGCAQKEAKESSSSGCAK